MRLLIIEDNQRLRNSIKLSLEEDGYICDGAVDGVEGQELAELTPYDAIILLTARDTVEDRVIGLDSGADDYLVKPFALDELQARLRALMRRDAPDKTGVLTAADLELDPVTHSIRRAGKSIDLTGKEYALLEYMLRNPNWLITREMAEQHVWDYGGASASNLVDVYIRRLRRKLDDPFEVKLIETVRGYGYRLNKPTN